LFAALGKREGGLCHPAFRFPDCKAPFIPLVICPTGNLLIGVSSPLAKYFSLCSSGKSSLQVRAIPSRKRGVGHRHERWARDAVDAAASGAKRDGRAGSSP
jgi:hypothetical protein